MKYEQFKERVAARRLAEDHGDITIDELCAVKYDLYSLRKELLDARSERDRLRVALSLALEKLGTDLAVSHEALEAGGFFYERELYNAQVIYKIRGRGV